MYLSAFKSVPPRFLVKQEQTLKWLAGIHAAARSNDPYNSKKKDTMHLYSLFERFGCSPKQIETREIEFAEVMLQNTYEDSISPILSNDIGSKAAAFSERSLQVISNLYDGFSIEEYPDHLLHVTCTGYVSPSAVQRFVSERDLDTAITHLYHMGCYASLPAVRTAVGLCAAENENYKIDIVHNEICSLHLNPNLSSSENLVVQSLFADGHIRYQVSKSPSNWDNAQAYEILAVHEKIIPNSSKEMSWAPAKEGMAMTLSRNVPNLITKPLKGFIEALSLKSNIPTMDLIHNSLFAVHPGGPKIIDQVAEILELSEKQIEDSRAILKNRGNMSSATLPHVWQRLLEHNKVKSGEMVVSLAFGPGLTVFGSVLKVV